MIYIACRAGAVAKLRRGDYHGRPGGMALRFREKGGNHQGIDISEVQELAGHADARTTKLYDRTNRKATRNLVEWISF